MHCSRLLLYGVKPIAQLLFLQIYCGIHTKAKSPIGCSQPVAEHDKGINASQFLWVFGLLQRVTLDWEIPISLTKRFNSVWSSKFPIQFLFPSSFHLLHRHETFFFWHETLITVWKFSPPCSAPSSFILHRHVPSISFGNLVPSLYLLLRGS